MFMIECNRCYCGSTGTYAECDISFCDPKDKTKQIQTPKDCKDNDTFYDGCNSCFCLSNVDSIIKYQNPRLII